jgi:hypothetical protein
VAPLSTLEHPKTTLSTLASTFRPQKAEVVAPRGNPYELRNQVRYPLSIACLIEDQVARLRVVERSFISANASLET